MISNRIFTAGLAFILIASPFLIQAAEPQRVVVSHVAQDAFAFEHDGMRMTTDALSTRLYKTFVRPYYFAAEAKNKAIHLTPADSAEAGAYARWQSVRYLSGIYDSLMLRGADSVSDTDRTAWYRSHQGDYRHYAVATYIQATLWHGHEADSAALRREMQRLATSGTDAATFQKSSNDKWAVNAERDVTITTGSATYPFLSATQKGQIVKGIIGKNTVYFLILSYSPETTVPEAEVKNDITKAIRTARLAQYTAHMTSVADSLVPIRLVADNIAAAGMKGGGLTYGMVGTDSIDNTFIARVQKVFPLFHFSERPDAFSTLLHNYVAIPLTKSKLLEARTNGALPAADAAMVDQISRDAYDIALAQKYEQEQRTQAGHTTEGEIQDYYRVHQSQFMRPGTCSYLKAELMDTSAATQAEARRALLAADYSNPEMKIRKDGKYVITREDQRPYDTGDALYTAITATPLRAVSTPAHMAADGPMLLLLPYQRIEPQSKPLDEVHDICRQAVANEKLSNWSEKLKAEIFGRFVFVLE